MTINPAALELAADLGTRPPVAPDVDAILTALEARDAALTPPTTPRAPTPPVIFRPHGTTPEPEEPAQIIGQLAPRPVFAAPTGHLILDDNSNTLF